jgi:hypothetical protein
MAASDRSKIDYAKKRLRRNYIGDDLTSGPLETGKFYRISNLVSGDDFTNVGASRNAVGLIFKATGTTPTTWANGSTLNEIKVDTLKADADIVFEAATRTVTLTSGSFEGGAHAGQITFEKDLLGQALEELIEELDPNYTQPPQRSDGSVIQFSA